MDGQTPRVITYKGGGSSIPSVFAIDERGNRLVGQEAKRQAQLNPANTVMASKRLIGRNFHSKTIDKVKQVFTYEMLEGENNEVLIKIKDQVFTLEQISAAILQRIHAVAEEALGTEVDQAVITVPAYFNDRQRQAVRNAGKLAELKVLRILNEPTAAALAYGLGKNLSQRIAVYDLGGGTFDVSVIDIKDRIFEVIATGGDTFLGGVDFDDRLMKHVLEAFLEDHGVDLSWDRVAIQRIRDAAETAKIELSGRTTTRIHIPYIAKGDTGPIDIDMEVTRSLLEKLTGDLVDRTIATCDRIFEEAGTTADQIDEVLLVGGQSRMPLVQKRVTTFLGKPPSKGVHPDEAVGIGAAIMAHSLSHGSDVTLLDVLPMPIGINKMNGTMHVLFQKNQPLPDYKTRTLTTSKDNQRTIMLKIYQGESRLVAENELLGTFLFRGIRRAPRGKVKIEVTFHIDSEGILNLTARDKETQQSVESTLRIGAQGKSKKKNTPKPPAPKPAPKAAPAPLNMPTSSLMQEIGGVTPPTLGKPAAAPAPRLQAPVPDPASPEGERQTEHLDRPQSISRPDVLQPSPTAPTATPDTTGAESTEDAETAIAERNVQAARPGVLRRVMGWFKGLFGG
jgi:molecular chaperone DnaK